MHPVNHSGYTTPFPPYENTMAKQLNALLIPRTGERQVSIKLYNITFRIYVNLPRLGFESRRAR